MSEQVIRGAGEGPSPVGAGLHESLTRWVALGLITDDQAVAIEQAERQPPPPPSPQPAEVEAVGTRRAARGARVPVVAEILGYVGAVVVAAATATVLTQFWPDLEPLAHLALVVVLTGLVAAAAWSISAIDEPAIARLCSFLWLLVVAGAAWAVGLVLSEQLDLADQDVAMGVALTGVVASGALLRWRGSALHHLALFVSVLALLLSGLGRIEDISGDVIGLAVWGVAVVWALLAWGGLLAHRAEGEVLGGAAALVGAATLASGAEVWGIWLGLLTAVALVALAAVTKDRALLLPGIPGLLGFTVAAIAYHFGGDEVGEGSLLPTVVLLVVGVVLLVVAVRGARHAGRPPGPGGVADEPEVVGR